MSKNLNLTHAHLRRDYLSDGLDERKMAANPMTQFGAWFDFASKAKIPDANAFVLATAGKTPAARVLLMKAWNRSGITFFTNYGSSKGQALKMNPRAEAVFYWGAQNRQVRLSGKAVRVSRKDSESYFFSRPVQAQIAAASSHQSRPIASRKSLESQFAQLNQSLCGKSPRMPEEWGGYELRVTAVEFWQGRPNRLHDRILYKLRSGKWTKSRLQP